MGVVRPRRRRATRDRGPFARVRVLGLACSGTRSCRRSTTATSASASTASRPTYEPDGSWRLVVAARDPGQPELAVDRRPPQGRAVLPVVPRRGDARPHRPRRVERMLTVSAARTLDGMNELEEAISGPPWIYPWRLRDGRELPVAAAELESVHRTRAEMIEARVRAALDRGRPDATALDLACNEGWFSQRLLEWGASRVVGVDVREFNIRRATLLRDHFEISPERLELRQADVFELDRGRARPVRRRARARPDLPRRESDGRAAARAQVHEGSLRRRDPAHATGAIRSFTATGEPASSTRPKAASRW